MSETGREPAPRPARARLTQSQRPPLRTGSPAVSTGSVGTTSTRSTTELWPGQAAQEAAREAARAEGAPPRTYRPSAYQDQYLAGASLEPFVHPLPRSASPTREAPGTRDDTGVDAGGAPGAASLFAKPALPAGDPASFGSTPDPDHRSGSPLAGDAADGEPVRGEDALVDELEELDPDEAAPSRRGRTVALVGAILAIVAVGAGGAFAYSALGGGGPQPETALPSTTVAFVKVDLDPSAGQKVDAVRFLRAFPEARDEVSEGSDLREVAFTALQEQGQLEGVDFRSDVAPWLGQRLALALVPGASAQEPPIAAVALAVTDPAAARAHLPKVAAALGGACQVVAEFAVCAKGKDGSALDTVLAATARGSLAESATFRQDMRDLGEDGIVAGWVDSAKTAELVGSLPALAGSRLAGLTGLTGATTLPPADRAVPYADAGRTAVALRFDGPHLELAGHTNGAKESFVGTQHVTGVTSLPWDSLAAVSIANGGEQLRAVWPGLEKGLASVSSPADGPLAGVEKVLGVTLPDDLCAALGRQFTVVFGGVEQRNGELRAAVVGDGDQVVLGKLAKAGQALGGKDLTLLPSPGRSVLATSGEYGQEVVTGSGLGDMPGFKDAVEDVEDARAVVYVDIAGLVSEFGDEMDPKDVADLGNLSALGVTVSGEGHSADFRIRLTTK